MKPSAARRGAGWLHHDSRHLRYWSCQAGGAILPVRESTGSVPSPPFGGW